VAVAGEPVGDSANTWHAYPDGAATFQDGEGGWYYVCNSEVFDYLTPTTGPQGGVGAIHFAESGSIIDSYRILAGSHSNCAGGPTPWGTWLSCEESASEDGLVYECDPTGQSDAVSHEAMGRWAHEAVAVDPIDERLYLTQDHPTGLLYRFTPDRYPDLSLGLLEAAIVATSGSVTWSEVPDPSGASAPTREQVPDARAFAGGEGIWYYDGSVYFTTKLDHSVWALDLRTQQLTLIWQSDPEAVGIEDAVLSGVDNITVDEGTGDLYVAEDEGNMELVIITAAGEVAPFCRLPGQDNSEITGPVFNPTRDRLYFSSQRGPSLKPLDEIVNGIESTDLAGGVTYEITGPFRGVRKNAQPGTTATVTKESTSMIASEGTQTPKATPAGTTPSPVTTLAELAAPKAETSDSGAENGVNGVVVGVGIAAVAAVLGGAIVLRKRGNNDAEDRET
jgi:secreted PhoX family phosphatase